MGIKNIGRALIDKIVASRKLDGEFKSYWDFCKRISGSELNRRALECLIKAGALDGLDLNRMEMLRNLDLAIESAAKESDMYAGGQLDMFSAFGGENFSNTPVFGKFPEMAQNELLAFEKEVAGLYFSGHPLEEYRTVSDALRCPKTIELEEIIEAGRESEIDNKQVKLICIVESTKKKITKRDETMAFSVVEDLYGCLEMIVFPKIFAAYGGYLNSGTVILAEGRLSVKDEEVKLIAEKISLAPKELQGVVSESEEENKQGSNGKKKGLFLRVDSKNSVCLSKAKNVLSIFGGNMPVYVYFKDTGKYEFLGSEYLISVNQPLKKELQLILGAENVVVRE